MEALTGPAAILRRGARVRQGVRGADKVLAKVPGDGRAHPEAAGCRSADSPEPPMLRVLQNP